MDIDRKSVFYNPDINIGCYCQACTYTYISNGININATKKGLKRFTPKHAHLCYQATSENADKES